MEHISVRDIYRMLLHCPDCTGDVAWLGQVPMIMLTGAARGCVFAIHLARRGRIDSARSFLTIADGLANEEERPYVNYLRSILEFLTGNIAHAVTFALEAEEEARALNDRNLLADVLAHLAEVHRTAGNTAAGRKYEAEADTVRREKH